MAYTKRPDAPMAVAAVLRRQLGPRPNHASASPASSSASALSRWLAIIRGVLLTGLCHALDPGTNVTKRGLFGSKSLIGPSA